MNSFYMINDKFISQTRLGFGSAMASNLTNQSRNVLSKKLMVKEEVHHFKLHHSIKH